MFYQELESSGNKAPEIATVESSEIFRQRNITTAAWIEAVYAGPGFIPDVGETGAFSTDKFVLTGKRFVNVVEYGRDFLISDLALRTNQHSEWAQTVREAAYAARQTQNKNGFALFNNGFTSTVTNTGDIWFSVHSLIKGGTTTNLLTTALIPGAPATTVLTPNALQGAYQIFTEMKSQSSMPFMGAPSILMVAPANYWNAVRIVQSSLVSGGNFNDVNPIQVAYSGLKVMQTPYIGASQGGSDTAYFLMGSNHSATRIINKGISTKLQEPVPGVTGNTWAYRVEWVETYFVSSYEGIVAATGL